MNFKKISWEDSAHLRNECGCLYDGVVLIAHGMMFEGSACHHVDDECANYWVVDVWDMPEYYGPESDITEREYIGSLCFDTKEQYAEWLATNVQKRLLMPELHDKDCEVFKALPCVSYKTA